MIDYTLLMPIILSFLVTLFVMPAWIRKTNQIGLIWEDMHKINSKKVAGSGGIVVLLGFIIGVLIFVGYRVFILQSEDFLVYILVSLLVIVLAGCIGFIDDLLGWQHGGLSRTSRLFLVLLSAVPLMVINAGKNIISLPLLGSIDIGIFYPLFLIPLGVLGATTTFNFLAGYNGLEAGQGVILLIAFSIVAYLTNNPWLSIVGLCMVVALLSFLYYNYYPAKIFPGDILTYQVGALLALMAIFGNFEKIALFFFIPYIFEVILKSRGRLIKQSFGKPDGSGGLNLKYDRVYGLEHLSIYLFNKAGLKATEKRVVWSIWIFQIIIILIGFAIFSGGIF